MAYGYHDRVLRVDLSSGRISVDEHDETWYRRYLGGAAVSAYYLLKELAPGIDPLGPDNKLIISPGVLTGIPVSGSGRNSVGAKSPMTGGIGKSEVGGFFGAELKRAGYDGVVIEGQSDRPVYLWIRDGTAELRDASDLWGKSTLETEDAIRAETGERFARVASIGPAGERLVRFACLMHDLKGAAGRGGMGAVMGSKKLKAIAARGTMAPSLADPGRVRELGKTMAAVGPVRARGIHEYGTGHNIVAYNLAGNIPVRNYQFGWFENIDAISPVLMKDTIRVGMDGCYACAIRCKKVVKVDEPWVVDPRYGGPEYETLAAFGCNCDIDDVKAISRANHLCNQYGMDTISAGHAIAFAMECFEKGYLKKSDLDGLELTWGNAGAMLKLLEMVGERQGIGSLLAEGTMRAAQEIGTGAEELSMQVKGLELSESDPRLRMGLGLNFCVANHGADHTTGINDTFFEKEGPYLSETLMPLGILEPMPANELSTRKAHVVAQLHRWRHFSDCASYCFFVPWTYGEMVDLVNATTGWNTTLEELLMVADRAITMGRAFNAREGFTPADDKLPKRFFSPPGSGPLAERNVAIDPEKMDESVRTFYYLMGWDPETGVPTDKTLDRLGIGWVADHLVDNGARIQTGRP